MKLLEAQIGLKPLAALCRRMAMSLGAGVDVRNVFLREANGARGIGRGRFRAIRDDVATGSTISDALATTGNYFPQFFREVVQVGEESGNLPEVLRDLADHYDHQLKLRRNFLIAITWPLIELGLALAVVGLLIWLMGVIPQLASAKVDILGFGLTGTSGLIKYLLFLGAVGLALFFIHRATTRGLLWVAPVQRAIMSIPRLGRAIETLAMARLAWAMHVTLNSGMDLRKALAMSLASTHNVVYTRHTEAILRDIRNGHGIHESFTSTGAFPYDFLDALQVGEDSGRLTETMAHMAQEYQDQARLAMNTLTILFGLVVTGLIAAVIIFMIFRVASFYIGVLNDATKI
jgi:type IV pilus assembly protein PilC